MQSWQNTWAHDKYWVMLHSQQFYNQIRQLARNNEWNEDKQLQYRQMVAIAATMKPNVKTMTTTYQHVWGYFKKIATDEEKTTYKRLLSNLNDHKDQMGPWLAQLTKKYQVEYLLSSKLIQELLNHQGDENVGTTG